MLVELPDHFDYDVDRIEFTVNGNPHYAVIASMRSAVAVKGRAEYQKTMAWIRNKAKEGGGIEQAQGGAEELDEFGLPVFDMSAPDDKKIPMARWCRRLVIETDCGDISKALEVSDDLKEVVLEAALALEAKFNAKKKS